MYVVCFYKYMYSSNMYTYMRRCLYQWICVCSLQQWHGLNSWSWFNLPFSVLQLYWGLKEVCMYVYLYAWHNRNAHTHLIWHTCGTCTCIHIWYYVWNVCCMCVLQTHTYMHLMYVCLYMYVWQYIDTHTHVYVYV